MHQTCKRPYVTSLALLLAVMACGNRVTAAEPMKLTYADLVGRLTDLERLATLPVEGEKSAMVSSYDRRSRFDEKTGLYVNWGANGDGVAPSENDQTPEIVVADLKGPGCIWRMWTATADQGRVKIYLDGASEPAVNLPFSEYFSGKQAPFNRPALSYHSAKGKNSYVPIPYAKSCRIVAEKGWGRYYQFTYSTFPEATQIPTFKRDLSPEDNAALDRANALLTETGQPQQREGQTTQKVNVTVEPKSEVAKISIDGARAITSIRLRVSDLANRAEEIAALRELTIAIHFDGDDKPAVWSPLGDFFGTAMGVNPYHSYATGMTKDGDGYALWFMPFGKNATIEFHNDGPNARRIEGEITHAPLTRPIDQYARFHAKWHRGQTSPKTADRWPDWGVMSATGRGRFVGMMLHVWNPVAGHDWINGREGGWWWGEGDEKFFVDGEKFPSTFGTGTEDYFGYAWCNPEHFERPFHGQTLTQINKGHQVVHRHQIADDVSFQKSFEGTLEKYYPSTRYAGISYFYLDPTGTDALTPLPIEKRTGYYDLTPATEGESLRVVEATGGKTEVQELVTNADIGESIFSGGRQLWWRDAKNGNRLTVAVPVANAGRYKVILGGTAARDHGSVAISAEKTPILAEVDYFSDTLGPATTNLGEHDLARGEWNLTIEMRGKHPSATGQLFGIDYVKLIPVK